MSVQRYVVLAALAVAVGVLPRAEAQTRFTLRVRPTAAFAFATIPAADAPVTAKMTADLAALVEAKDKQPRFIGLTPTSEAVVEFGPKVKEEDARESLEAAGRNLAVNGLGEKKYEKAERLLIIYAGKKAPTEVGGMKVVDSHPEGNFVVVESKEGFTAEQIERLASDKAARMVQPNYLYQLLDRRGIPTAAPTGNPNDPLFPKLWGMKNINAPIAWKKLTSSMTRVAIIDTGIDLKHKDLKANIVPGLSKDFSTDNDPQDTHSHGTHCAGTIAAVGDNSEGVVGVVWTARIFGVKIFGKTGFAGDVQVAKAIDYAVANKARVLSNSWGGGAPSPVLKGAIDRAQRRGVLFVAAAGNHGGDNDANPFYPASYPNANIISVLAIDETDRKASFSAFGKYTVDIGAPGVDILSTVLNSKYDLKSGTSMATPHVSGAAALIWAHPKYQKYTATQIKSLMLKNARHLADLKGKCRANGTLDIKFLK
jgi:subtilisin family serine protease